MPERFLGIDTSNYRTSAAIYNAETGEWVNRGGLLTVPEGAIGLRQSDALFQHTVRLHEKIEALPQGEVRAIGVSTRPRAVEGSYMPCFLAGESQGRALAAALGVPFFACSHQQGHLAAAAWSAGRTDLLDGPFLAWHLSGGTTELLLVRPQGTNVAAEKLGGTSDISAGQLIDRTGVLLGLQFPAGKALDELYPQADACMEYRVKLKDLTFSLSGMENQVKRLLAEGEAPANVARFTLDTVCSVVLRATQEAQRRCPGLPVLCSGGVASNRLLRTVMSDVAFAAPQYSTDNAMGAAILAWRSLGQEAEA